MSVFFEVKRSVEECECRSYCLKRRYGKVKSSRRRHPAYRRYQQRKFCRIDESSRLCGFTHSKRRSWPYPFLRRERQVPCIQTGTGICHVYVDESADFEKALQIIENAKTSRQAFVMQKKFFLFTAQLLKSSCHYYRKISRRTKRKR